MVIRKLIHIIIYLSIPFVVFAQAGENLDPVYAYGENFSSSDPPMFFIYHFVTLDEKKIDKISEPSGKIITQSIDEGITTPQLLSTMMTTAIGKWGQIKIAGESIQRRLGNEKIIDLMKNYDYPNETDYIVLGEINTLSINYEIDLKIMDVSTQDIILSHAFRIQKNEIEELRNTIDKEVSQFMYKLLKPFCGFVSIKVDESSRDFLRWDYISIRPLKTQVGGKIIDTEEKDLRIVSVSRNQNKVLGEYYPNLTTNDYSDYGIIWNETFSTLPLGLLSGNYELVAFFKGNKEKYQTFFEVVSGQVTLIDIKIPLPPISPPLPPPTGSLAISNLFEGINIYVSMIIGDAIIPKVKANILNGELGFDYKDHSIGYKRNKSELLLTNLQLGTYLFEANTVSNETFPGKYYTLLYSFEDTVRIDKRDEQSNISLPDKKNNSGREIIIYLNPFPESKDEEYKFFLNNYKTPFSIASNVGEMHIVGVAYDFSGNIIVKRDDYKSSSLPIEAGIDKLYLHADLSQSKNPQINFDRREEEKRKEKKRKEEEKRKRPKDCAGVVGGSAVIDECGVCDGDGASCKKENYFKKIEKQFGGFWGFPGGTLNGNANFSKNKYNLSASYGTDFSEITGYEIGIGIRSPYFKILKYDNLLVKFVMGNRSWDDVDYSYKGIMINKGIKKFFGEVGLVIGNDDVYDGPQLVMKLGLLQ